MPSESQGQLASVMGSRRREGTSDLRSGHVRASEELPAALGACNAKRCGTRD